VFVQFTICKLADFPNFGRPAFLFANKRSKEL
jgi:hypothetical protein